MQLKIAQRIDPVGAADSLVVLLHGYGANGDDLAALGHEWRRLLPRTAFVAPHAPEPVPFGGGGFQWFDLTLRDPDECWRGVGRAGPLLGRFLDAELRRYRLDGGRLALVGFSQGTMMALHVGLRRAVAPAAIVGFSGLLAGPEHLEKEVSARPPVLLAHGEADDMIPVAALHMAREALAHCGVPVEWHALPDLSHGIDQDGLRIAGEFLRQHLSG